MPARHGSVRFLIALFFVSLALVPVRARAADPMRDFVMSCSYGVLAGTLVGAAALAFTDKPGDNLNLIARGASIGLYAGIALGLYVTSAPEAPEEEVPSGLARFGEADWEKAARYQATGPGVPRSGMKLGLARPSEPRAYIVPLFGARGVEGGSLQFALARF